MQQTSLPANATTSTPSSTETTMSSASASNDSFKREMLELIGRLDRQVADLQADQVQSRRPWYRDIATIISLLAFTFAVATTVFSYVQASQQRVRDLRAELRSLLARQAEIARENMELPFRYPNAAAIAQTLSGALQSENAALLSQAVEVARQIPDQISSGEYLQLGFGATLSNSNDEAHTFFDQAIQRARTANDKVGPLRAQAQLFFGELNAERGRDFYRQALDVFKSFPTKNEYLEGSTQLQTLLGWTRRELELGNCAEAGKQFDEAQKLTTRLTKRYVLLNQMRELAQLQTIAQAKGCAWVA